MRGRGEGRGGRYRGPRGGRGEERRVCGSETRLIMELEIMYPG